MDGPFGPNFGVSKVISAGRAIIVGECRPNSLAIAQAGLLLLVATPVFRVGVSAVDIPATTFPTKVTSAVTFTCEVNAAL
jgi:uncharacterized membrane protein